MIVLQGSFSFLQVEEHQLGYILSLPCDSATEKLLDVEEHQYGFLLSLLYNNTPEELFYRLKSTSSGI